jgi:hypothetical protein
MAAQALRSFTWRLATAITGKQPDPARRQQPEATSPQFYNRRRNRAEKVS